jgi:hypothetical protein
MTIRITRYTLSTSPLVQAFVDIEVDGWLRFKGLNYNRDGTLRSAQNWKPAWSSEMRSKRRKCFAQRAAIQTDR